MGKTMDRFLAISAGLGFEALAIYLVVWLPSWWGLLLAPGLLWLGWLLVTEARRPAPLQMLPPVDEPVRHVEHHTDRRMAA